VAPPPGRARSRRSHGAGERRLTDLDWKAWRRAERERLIGGRLAISADARQDIAALVTAQLESTLALRTGMTVSFYWPFRGELDLRPWITALISRGLGAALPVVTEKHAPMSFRPWSPGAKMERGIWNIPVPADPAEVTPDIIIAPLVGFDPACYRLGYGGGYFDRTLAALPHRPVVAGVGYDQSRLATIHPQPHDIAMDLIVTETTVLRQL
jgi:5,10-methenyltetrahydrofolate synthetase